MFVDYSKIEVRAGDGGKGARAFRREKYVPRGGPSGGNGGDGGSVYLKSSSHLNTLLPFRYKKHFQAKSGAHGSGKKNTHLEIKMGFPTKIRPKLKIYTHFVQDKGLSYHFHKKIPL